MNLIDQFIQASKQAIESNPAIKAGMSPVTDVVNAINPRPDSVSNQSYSVGGFLNNAATGIGQLAQGMISIPKDIYTGITQPDTVGSGITNTIKGIGTSVNNMVGQPINPKTGNIQQPSLAEAGQYAYNNPVSVATNLLPFAKGVGLAGDAAKAGDIADTAEATTLPKIEATTTTKTGNKMITSANASTDAVANYNSMFQVPRNISQNMKIKPDAIINQLINDGITNVKNIDDLKSVADNVTGENGAFPTINRIILNDIKSPIDYSDAAKAIPNSISKYLEGSPKGLTNTVQNQIERAMPSYPDGDALNFGSNAYASDLFDSTQELDSLARMYNRKAYTVMGELTNPEYERAGDAIQEVSNNIKNSLDKSISPEQYQQYKTDPRIQQQLQRVPQPMAQRFMQNAKQFRDGRTIQAPYVGLSKMVEDTKESQLSASTKLMNKMGEQQMNNSGSMVDNATNFLQHPITNTLNIGAKKILSPIVDKTPEQLMQEKTSGVSASLKPSTHSLIPFGRSSRNLSTFALPTIADNHESNNSNQNPNASYSPQAGYSSNQGNPENDVQNHSSIISQSYSNIKPDIKTGQIELPQTPPEGQNTRHYMTTQDYQSGLQQLAQQYPAGASDPHYTVAKNLLDTQFANDQKQADEVFKGNNVKNFMDNAVQYNNDGKDLNSTLHALPVGFWNGVSKAGSIRSYSDPSYAKELQQIDSFNNEFTAAYTSVTGEKPTENQLLNSANSPAQAATKYINMMQFISGTYGKYLAPYATLTSATGGQTSSGTPQKLNALPPIQATPQNANSIVGGNAPQAQYTNGQWSLPAIQ